MCVCTQPPEGAIVEQSRASRSDLRDLDRLANADSAIGFGSDSAPSLLQGSTSFSLRVQPSTRIKELSFANKSEEVLFANTNCLILVSLRCE